MFRGVLRDKDNYLLEEKFGRSFYDVDYYEDHVAEILKKGGSIDIKFVGELQRVESNEGFI